MSFNVEYVCTLLTIIWFLQFILKPYLEKKNELKDKEIKNKRDEIFIQLDPEFIEKEIDKLIKKELDQYVLINFISNSMLYIPKPEIERMIIRLTDQVYNELSGLYIFYIRTLVNIESEEDILIYTKKKVQDQVLEFTINYNKTRD